MSHAVQLPQHKEAQWGCVGAPVTHRTGQQHHMYIQSNAKGSDMAQTDAQHAGSQVQATDAFELSQFPAAGQMSHLFILISQNGISEV